MSIWTGIVCWRYRARLEERVSSNGLRPEPDSQLDAHLSACSDCREALDDAILATELLRQTDAPAMGSSSQFPMRVMASIRVELARQAAPDVIWRPLELLASRFALGAAAALLVVSIYIAEFAPPFRPPAASSQAEVGATAVMPEPPVPPSNPDEVLASLTGDGQ